MSRQGAYCKLNRGEITKKCPLNHRREYFWEFQIKKTHRPVGVPASSLVHWRFRLTANLPARRLVHPPQPSARPSASSPALSSAPTVGSFVRPNRRLFCPIEKTEKVEINTATCGVGFLLRLLSFCWFFIPALACFLEKSEKIM